MRIWYLHVSFPFLYPQPAAETGSSLAHLSSTVQKRCFSARCLVSVYVDHHIPMQEQSEINKKPYQF